MAKIIALLAITLSLVACGISYGVPRSTMHLDLKRASDLANVVDEIDSFLRSRGFEKLGKDTKMLEFLESTDAKHNEFVLEMLRREMRFKNRAENIEVVLIDYSEPKIKKRHTNYPSAQVEPTDTPALEINIYHHRPGGFGPKAHLLHSELNSYLRAKYAGHLITIFEPPATNQAEYYKVTTVNLVSSAVWWVVVFGLSLLLFGTVSRKLLNRTQLGLIPKRAAFTLISSLLVTPLPFPTGFIFTVVLPSVLALPSIGTDYFSRIQSYALPSFGVSILLCAAISVFLFKSNATKNI